MAEITYRRHRFPPTIIQHAVWLYLRFTLSYRDVEELLAERALDISYETVRCWVLKFGPVIARRLRRCRPRPSDRWHLDEMVVRIAGKRMYLWRAVDHEGEVLEILVQRRRDRSAAVKLMRKLLRKQGFAPTSVTTDKLRSYGAAFRHLGLSCHHEPRDPSLECSRVAGTSYAAAPSMRLTRRMRSLTRHSRSRLGRLASSSASVGTRTMLQWPRSPRSQPRNPRLSNSVSSRSVLARRCSRDTATLEGWITCASTPRAASQRASQKPSRPASKARAIRVMLPPALTASSRQRCSRASSRSGLGSSFLRG